MYVTCIIDKIILDFARLASRGQRRYAYLKLRATLGWSSTVVNRLPKPPTRRPVPGYRKIGELAGRQNRAEARSRDRTDGAQRKKKKHVKTSPKPSCPSPTEALGRGRRRAVIAILRSPANRAKSVADDAQDIPSSEALTTSTRRPCPLRASSAPPPARAPDAPRAAPARRRSARRRARAAR